jgi:four helix bundle protein
MATTARDLMKRTEDFAVAVVRLCRTLPDSVEGRKISAQLIDSSNSVAANYRSARRAQSRRHFVSKLCVVLEESDESALWLTMIIRNGLSSDGAAEELKREAEELTAIFAAAVRTARLRA